VGLTEFIDRIRFRDPEALELQRFKRKLAREAQAYAQVIRERLTRMNVCYRYKKKEDDFLKSNVQQVSWIRAITTPEAIYLLIDTRRLPRGVSVDDLGKRHILNDLSVNCRRKVRFRKGKRSGAWYIVERKKGHWGILRKLPFADVWKKYPSSSRKKLLVPLGVGENRKVIFESLASFPHALIGGVTGSGKSTFMHSWICTLIRTHEPQDLRLGLVDLKGGVEFTFYQKLPHLIDNSLIGSDELQDETGLIKRARDVLPLLRYLHREMDQRLMRFEKKQVQSLQIWNYRRSKHRLPRLVLFVDELASIMLDPDLKKEATRLLADITARGRAPGIHVVLATQRPEVKVVDGQIKGNLDARFAFQVPDNASSMVILDNTQAAKMYDAPPGRYIYQRGMTREQIQAPLITGDQVKDVVTGVLEGDQEREISRMSAQAIFDFSIDKLGGRFSIREMYDSLQSTGHDVPRHIIERLGREYEGEVIEIDDALYELQPSAGTKPRQFIEAGSNGRAEE